MKTITIYAGTECGDDIYDQPYECTSYYTSREAAQRALDKHIRKRYENRMEYYSASKLAMSREKYVDVYKKYQGEEWANQQYDEMNERIARLAAASFDEWFSPSGDSHTILGYNYRTFDIVEATLVMEEDE